MKPSREVKRRAPRRDIIEEKLVDGKKELITRSVLAVPLKQWAKQQIATDGDFSGVCLAWLGRKGCRA